MTQQQNREVCGIVMPLSPIDGCDSAHWDDVRNILSEAIDHAGFSPRLVSEADEVRVIQSSIIANLYENRVVVCDVSGKNPNVMFELGMRLAFDKPTIIVKDNDTDYVFDVANLEHISYPRSLRHGEIEKFKKELAGRIKKTVSKAKADANFSPFLGSFGPIKVAKIEHEEVPVQKFILDELKSIRQQISALAFGTTVRSPTRRIAGLVDSSFDDKTKAKLSKLADKDLRIVGVSSLGKESYGKLASGKTTKTTRKRKKD